MPLKICEDAVLGKGGYGFVCKGELTLEVCIGGGGGGGGKAGGGDWE